MRGCACGARLLEANVRSFLSAAGKVNKGIGETLKRAPERFMAYNNGIVPVADEMHMGRADNGAPGILWLKGMQIVNGGQTTASLYFTKKKEPKTDISRVRAPPKIILLRCDDPAGEELKRPQIAAEHCIGAVPSVRRKRRRENAEGLKAGVLEDGRLLEVERGTPQGALISPVLANIYLHCVLDLWAHQCRRRQARSRVVIVRYADDFVMGFEDETDARKMFSDLKERLAVFDLSLHGDKTRLIEFGRFPALARRRRGARHPESFAFLGFTHHCGWTRDGRFIVKHKTQSQRLTQKLKALRREARRPRLRCLIRTSRSIIAAVPVCRNTSISPGIPAWAVTRPVSSLSSISKSSRRPTLAPAFPSAHNG